MWMFVWVVAVFFASFRLVCWCFCSLVVCWSGKWTEFVWWNNNSHISLARNHAVLWDMICIFNVFAATIQFVDGSLLHFDSFLFYSFIESQKSALWLDQKSTSRLISCRFSESFVVVVVVVVLNFHEKKTQTK